MSVLVTPPVVEPVTAAEVKLRLKYPRTDQDAAIDDWIKAARDAVERYVERGLLTQTWRLTTRPSMSTLSARIIAPGIEATDSHVDWFTHNLTAVRSPRAVDLGPASFGYIDLPWAAPVQAVESVTDSDGTVVDPAAYVLDDTVEPARLYWVNPPAGVASIVYRIGYGDTPESVPSVLRNVVHALVAQFFLYRSGPPPQSALDATLRQADGYRVRVLC